MQLFDTLSVRDNVRIGCEAAIAGANPVTQLASVPRQRAMIEEAAGEAIALCDLEALADTPAADLSTGERRLVELARCFAGRYDVVLLDEPSSGLDRTETRRFGEILRRVVEQRGLGILLVEHDMSLVMELCSHIYVMDFGKLIFAGSPVEVRAAEVVQAAYLGSEALEPEVVEGSRVVEDSA
jgi:ABC-type branched-subunit amino acid transport system ATPase component